MVYTLQKTTCQLVAKVVPTWRSLDLRQFPALSCRQFVNSVDDKIEESVNDVYT